jgi:hypothetical protein
VGLISICPWAASRACTLLPGHGGGIRPSRESLLRGPPRHLARHGHVAPADQPDIRDRVLGRAERPGGDQRRPVAGEAGDAMDAGGLNRFGQGHGRQDGGEPPGQHPCARSRTAKNEKVIDTTLASALPYERHKGEPRGFRSAIPYRWWRRWPLHLGTPFGVGHVGDAKPVAPLMACQRHAWVWQWSPH